MIDAVSHMTPPVCRPDAGVEFPFREKEFRFIAELMHATTGIKLNPSKMNMVYARLVRRLRELDLSSFSAYCNLLRGPDGQEEMSHLFNALTTNLTRFFREPHHFDHLRDVVVPALVARASRSRRIRIWSAGCSSGEEPYSIAMVLAEQIHDLDAWDARILATDLDSHMLATGAGGVYSLGAAVDIGGGRLNRHFVKAGVNLRVDERLRRLIAFKRLNLVDPWPMKGPFDAIFCRNVMIYFDAPTKVGLVRRLSGLLSPGSWFYVGHSESLLEPGSNLVPDGRTVYRKDMACH
ncbi:MAG: protein-glutamate O-methyltransferase CheR [Ancalomicrobiaceae bacterium]|nr:protein-glutamate O-methyltransferase CheR [Ancalomicrobiaceae bacterium]